MTHEVQNPTISLARRHRGVLVAVCLVAALLGLLLRNDRPIKMLVAGHRALQIATEAERKHASILAVHDPAAIPDPKCAERIETETVPLWREAVSLMEQAHTVGAKGATFEGLTECYRLRLDASEAMATAIRSRDPELLATAQRQWHESEIQAQKIKSTPIALPFRFGG